MEHIDNKEVSGGTFVGTCLVQGGTEKPFEDLSPAEKLDWLGNLALDRKRDLLGTPLPADDDDSVEAHRLRTVILTAADSTINQIIKVNEVRLRARQVDMLPEILARIDAALSASPPLPYKDDKS